MHPCDNMQSDSILQGNESDLDNKILAHGSKMLVLSMSAILCFSRKNLYLEKKWRYLNKS